MPCLPSMASGCLPLPPCSPSSPSGAWRALLLLLSCCLWWTAAACGRSGGSGLNKLVGSGGGQDWFGAALDGRLGGGQMGRPAGSGSPGKVSDAASWSSYMAANFGCCDLRPRWRPLHTPVQLLRLCVFNLLKWRPFFLDATVQAFLRPSGFVPGAEAGRRAPRWFSASGDGEDEGLDGVSANLCRVLFAKNLDQVVLSFSFEVLSVNCKVTADE